WTPWDMVAMGWKYNLSNIEAAILLPQLDRMGRKLDERDALAAAYDAALADIDGLTIPASRTNARHARHLYTVWLPEHVDRNVAVDRLKALGVSVVVNYLPIHTMSYYRDRHGLGDGMFPVTESIGRRTISLPFYPGMPLDHIARVAESIREVVAAV
ncbi:MAG: DegT/DnrJ/EryC1/StrS family aminotransferase, partial [bacterium]|nr:DegT/DnrJ/EryC1/StrS family aminotransferase [bacterium]